MRRRYRWRVLGLVLLGLTATTAVAAQQASAQPECGVRVAVRTVTLTVDGEPATGRVYEPYRCAPGDLAPRDLIVGVHGHNSSSATLGDYLLSVARRTTTPLLVMDMRGPDSAWPVGAWNLRAGRDDVLAATRWYRDEHPAIERTVLWGWSQGGITSGLVAAAAPPGLYDYWVDNFGPADDFTAWLGADLAGPELRGQIERDAGGCTPLACPGSYAELSPALRAAGIGVRRSFLVHGLADRVVPYPTSLEMRAALAAAGKPFSMYTIATGRDLDGAVVPGDHSLGPAYFEGGCVVERLLTDTEPVDGPDRDYLVDVARGVVTAPPAPPGAKCAA
ncbi:alpha/beta hydrolase family protein [Nocardia blacklockiae]|uniref:alpha/beta hydrolase family protein n=1 Tax=Nocardia blacklockiae TaxID=480036 RepID=UPI00189438CF|nr:prolyl oligopeptidase family serine peptidase [Nocardia blacklockiae]MBF6174244.1 prolyl oligopeptidase family serine peptidase [Nocardia blacklockiae]